MNETTPSQPLREYVDCPECEGRGMVWATYHYGEIQAECPYCGGDGRALKRAVERDYPAASNAPSQQSDGAP